MSSKLTSMLAILKLLDQGRIVTRAGLADRVGVDPRTIDRYISALRAAHFPIQYDKQKKTYAFENGYRLGRTDFTPEETLVLSLARTALNRDFGPKSATVLDNIEKKIGVCDLRLPKYVYLATNIQSPVVEERFRILLKAIQNLQKIEIVYDTLYRSETSCRMIDPYYLFFNEGIWLLRGYCYRSKELRTFALDQMQSLRVLDEYFVLKWEVTPEEELAGTFGSFISGDPVTVVLRFKKEFAPFIKRKTWQRSQVVKELGDGGIEVTFRVNGLKGIKPWIYRWIPYVEVMKPEELRKIVRLDLQKACAISK